MHCSKIIRGGLRALMGVGAAGLLSACAGIMHGDHQSVTIFTDPPESRVVIDQRVHLTAPGKVSLTRKEDHLGRAEKDGYHPMEFRVERGMSNWEYANIVCLIFIYWCVKSDREDGSFWTFDDEVRVSLTQ